MSALSEYHPDGRLICREDSALPEILDLLVVGGGPAGTAAAFHGKELGLKVLVIDYDDLMKRIRDYPKDKLILPDFGGGDQMKFPKGGELVSKLAFSAADKDEIVAAWKCYYRDNNIPAQVGIELLGLERDQEALWRVRTWNHGTKSEQVYKARHVAIAIGRGVPRRFDIPGNTDGIAYRLTDPAAYVGEAALVIGGGTSAAEAVIAVSNAKVRKGDSSPVYWSYRGDKLPKVSKALADTFFEAYLGNGNIRYLPNSEPVAVVAAEANQEFLSVRVDRKILTGRPNETTHLEFRKERCMACIGEDIPEAFLNSLGIFMATGGPANKKRMVVTPILETQQPNVYLIGDILSQAYLETENFAADSATFREVKHRGNIKAALRDGVLVAKVAAQRVSGKKEFDIELDFIEEEKGTAGEKSEASALATIFAQTPKKTTDVPPKEVESGSFLVRILPGGVQEEEFQLREFGVTTIGRKFCDIVVPEDEGMSERHASISHEQNGFFLRDDGSAAGVFLRFPEGGTMTVDDGDLLRIGRQFLLMKTKESDASFTHYNQHGERVDWYPLPEKTIVVGRDAPDIVLDPADGSLSRRHLSLTCKDGRIIARDLKSLNGTYLKVRDAVKIEPGAVFRLGRQTFMLALQQGKPQEKMRVSTRVSQVQGKPKQTPQPEKIETPASGMTVTFRNTGKTVTFERGETLCDIAEKNGVKIVAECHAGICGSDPVRIVSGGQGLNQVTSEERGTLEDICGLQPGECRLACMVRPSGQVEVEILG